MIALQWTASRGLLRNYLTKTATYEWAAMDCNERNFEELPLTKIEM